MTYAKKSAEARGIARARSQAAKWSRVRFRDNRVVKSSPIAAGGCWCGETYGHPWPGRDEGAPHPVRDLPPVPPKVQARMAQEALQASGVCPTCRGYPPYQTMHKKKPKPWCDLCMGSGEFPPPTPYEIERRWKEES